MHAFDVLLWSCVRAQAEDVLPRPIAKAALDNFGGRERSDATLFGRHPRELHVIGHRKEHISPSDHKDDGRRDAMIMTCVCIARDADQMTNGVRSSSSRLLGPAGRCGVPPAPAAGLLP